MSLPSSDIAQCGLGAHYSSAYTKQRLAWPPHKDDMNIHFFFFFVSRVTLMSVNSFVIVLGKVSEGAAGV